MNTFFIFFLGIVLSILSIFVIFICACWDNDDEICWQLIFGDKLGTYLYNLKFKVVDYLKNFWK